MLCSRQIFRCFKAFERFGDWVTGKAGPFFVGLAVILLGLGTIVFFDVIQPRLSFPWLSTPICILITLNMGMHYYYACTVSPGFVVDLPPEPATGLLWARPRKSDQTLQWTDDMNITPAAFTKCKKCRVQRPERAHHCRICNRCVLKYDHHCPVRINQCVGIYNERHFVLFLVYLFISCASFAALGYTAMFDALGITFQKKWPHRLPVVCFILIYILAAVMSFAVGAMGAFHLYTVACGETTVESQDHEHYRKLAQSRNEVFVNSFDMGKKQNLKLFFNIRDRGYPFYTLLLPLRIMTYTDGRSWARPLGYARHGGLRQGEELTDEDDDDLESY